MKLPRHSGALLATVAFPVLGAVFAAAPAHAATSCSGIGTSVGGTTFNGCVLADAGLNVRSHGGTGNVTWNDTVIFTLPYNTRVHVHCYFYGPSVTGPYGTTTIWDAVDAYIEPGQSTTTLIVDTGEVVNAVASDAWIYTGTNNAVVPKCNGLN